MTNDNGLLPHNIDLERAVISGLVTAPDLKDEIAAIVQANDFSDPRHRTIFQAAMALDGQQPDLLTLINYLQQKGEKCLKAIGGVDYLFDLAADPPFYPLIAQYARQVAELARQRRIEQGAAKITELAHRGDVQAALDLARKMAETERPASADWSWRSLTDACGPKAPRRYAVSGVIKVPSLNIVYGASGDLKSMLCLDASLCVASGKPWLEGLPDDPDVQPYAVTQAPALWVDVDQGLDELERRISALRAGHNIPEDAPFLYVSFPSPSFVASEPTGVQTVVDAVQATGAELVIFDNLGTISGGADENSSAMVAVTNGLRQIAELGDCAVVVIHHPTKSERKGWTGLRGHGSIIAALDLALEVTHDGDIVTLVSQKDRGASVRPFSALWTYEQDDAGELTKGRFFGLGRPEIETLNKQQQAELCILKELRSGMNQSQIVDLVKEQAGVGRNTTIAAVKRLVDSGKLYARVGQAHGAIEYDRVQAI